MISFLSPWVMALSVAASVATVVLHLLSVRRPPVYELPTARFVAPRDARAVSRSARPSDVLLLVLRVMAMLLAGAAIAGPRWVPGRATIAQIIVADPSWRADSASMRGAGGLDTTGGSAADGITYVWTDSVHGLRDELGAAWPMVWRAAGALLREQPSLDSVAVHVFAPVSSASVAGWQPWRSAWPGRVTLHVRPPSDSLRARVVQTLTRETRDDDVVRAALALRSGPAGANAQRTSGTVDSVRVEWPTDGVPAGWAPASDTVGALVAGGQAMVWPWIRRARSPLAQAPLASASSADGAVRVIARWSDGEAAATERLTTGGCTRTVGVLVPNGSDVLNTPAANGLFAALSASCGGSPSRIPLALVADSGGPAALASAASLRGFFPRDAGVVPDWLPAALLVAAMSLLAAEQLLRRGADADAVTSRASTRSAA